MGNTGKYQYVFGDIIIHSNIEGKQKEKGWLSTPLLAFPHGFYIKVSETMLIAQEGRVFYKWFSKIDLNEKKPFKAKWGIRKDKITVHIESDKDRKIFNVTFEM